MGRATLAAFPAGLVRGRPGGRIPTPRRLDQPARLFHRACRTTARDPDLASRRPQGASDFGHRSLTLRPAADAVHAWADEWWRYRTKTTDGPVFYPFATKCRVGAFRRTATLGLVGTRAIGVLNTTSTFLVDRVTWPSASPRIEPGTPPHTSFELPDNVRAGWSAAVVCAMDHQRESNRHWHRSCGCETTSSRSLT